MIRVAICDDQESCLKEARHAVDSYFQRRPDLSASVSEFRSSSAFLEKARRGGGWDIVILDIYMPGVNGMDAARLLRQGKKHTEIIFMSVSPDYAVDAFSLDAVHYVLKPLSEKLFDEAMDRALKAFTRNDRAQMLLSLEGGTVQRIYIDSILYIESVGYKRVVHTSAGDYEETRKTLTAFLNELEKAAPGQFMQPYRGYIVNLNEIRSVSPDNITMQNGSTILIKRGDFRRIRNLFFEWMFASPDAERV